MIGVSPDTKIKIVIFFSMEISKKTYLKKFGVDIFLYLKMF